MSEKRKDDTLSTMRAITERSTPNPDKPRLSKEGLEKILAFHDKARRDIYQAHELYQYKVNRTLADYREALKEFAEAYDLLELKLPEEPKNGEK